MRHYARELWGKGIIGCTEEDKRATTNVQHRFVLFFLLSFFTLLSHQAKTFVLKGKVLGDKF